MYSGIVRHCLPLFKVVQSYVQKKLLNFLGQIMLYSPSSGIGQGCISPSVTGPLSESEMLNAREVGGMRSGGLARQPTRYLIYHSVCLPAHRRISQLIGLLSVISVICLKSVRCTEWNAKCWYCIFRMESGNMNSHCLLWIYVVCAVLFNTASGLENGLARTPPMGWLSWERFRCNTDCKNDPDNCISENLFRTMTDLVVSEGYAAVGYEYINVDDCWLEKERGFSGELVADRERFPRGMRDLSNYVHSKGLKFGIYEDYGNYTCAGYPGVLGSLEKDAQTFADWDVDYVKLDGCYSHPRDMDKGYPEFGYYLNKTGRAMVYSCSWPVYQIYAGMSPNFSSIIQHCNLWRNFDDIQDSWASVESIIDYYGNNQDTIVPNAGPGHWNDPDMLIIGNFGLSYEQSKTQMAIWAILAAPLLMSVDLRNIRPEYKAILQNRKIIAVDQDPLGYQGRRIYKHNNIEIWSRPITPIYQNYFSYAVAFVNRRTDGTPSDIAVTLRELGLAYPGGYSVEDLYEDVNYGVLTPQTKIKVKVNPSGVVILRADVQPQYEQTNRFSSLHTPYDPYSQIFQVRQNTF